jgi:iron complex outermembrane recepter protein
MRPDPSRAGDHAARTSTASLATGICWWGAAILSLAGADLAVSTASAAATSPVEELRDLSLEELANLQITSVSKRSEALSKAAASVFVITGEDIRRSGATSLPEALRLAPNLEVARLDSQNYAISARGFNTFQASNKLLVLIDGRSVYTALHAGVFWDQHQVMLEDIDRIEVISGPGGTLWGANAVNGVINVITKGAAETQGALASLQAGNVDQTGAARYGGRLGERGSYRVYGLGFERGDTETADGEDVNDDWLGRQGGFRLDWRGAVDGFTVQGDLYSHLLPADGELTGGNLLGRWTRALSEDSDLQLQVYYDQSERSTFGVQDELQVFDASAQHNFALGTRHQIVWGAGYRVTDDKFVNTLNAFVLDPESDVVQHGNLFVQDSIGLTEDLTLTLGTKFEYSSFSGFEYLPSGRVAWSVTDTTLLWAAVSRAVRTPSRIDRDLVNPGILDQSELESEKLIAYEVGYRGQPTSGTYLSVSLYYHDYEDLRALAASAGPGLFAFDNAMEGEIYGLEAWGDVDVTDWWRLSAGVNLIESDLKLKENGLPLALDQHQGNDPEYQLSLRSRMDLGDDLELDLGLRAVDELPSPEVPRYVELDARLGWHVSEALELWVGGSNLLHARHRESGAELVGREIPRSVYAGLRWRL